MSETQAVDVVTFGCRLNGVESEAMQREALAAGWRDLTIVNSCAVTGEASRQARQAIRRIRREGPGRRIVVTGCASEADGALLRAMPEIDAILPNATKTDRATWRLDHPALGGDTAIAEAPVSAHSRGFVEVQNGCDHRCTFCIIPHGRGASRSRPLLDVEERVRQQIARGAREIVLTGVDVTAYGMDLDGRPTLGALVQSLLRTFPDLPRLRLSSLDCIEADPALIETFGDQPRLMPHLHLSIQAGSDLILRRMKRRHSRSDVIAFCHRLRAIRPDIALGADLIVGFPTETEAMFAETARIVEECDLASIHVFPFSPRPGTPAARMPPVDRALVTERAARLRDLAQAQARRHLGRKVGSRQVVLTERGGKGHLEDFTLVRLPDPMTPSGLLMPVAVTGTDGRALLCEPA